MVTVTTSLRLGLDSVVLKKSSRTTLTIRKINAFQKFLKEPQKKQHQIIIKNVHCFFSLLFRKSHSNSMSFPHLILVYTKGEP